MTGGEGSVSGPRLPEPRISRPRLESLLGSASPVIYFNADAGTGKSTAIAAGIAAVSEQSLAPTVIWLGQDLLEASREELLGGIAAGARQLQAAATVQDHDSAQASDSLTLEECEALLLRLLATSQRPLVIVLDDYRDQHPEVVVMLTNLARTNRRLTLVAASSQPTLFDTAELASKVSIAAVRNTEFRVTAEELRELVHILHHTVLGSTLSQLVLGLTEGNLQGIRLLLHRMSQRKQLRSWSSAELKALWGSLMQEGIAAYNFTEETLLLIGSASLAEKVPASLAAQLNGGPGWEPVFAQLVELGLGSWWRSGSDEPVFRYLSSFRVAVEYYYHREFPLHWRMSHRSIAAFLHAREEPIAGLRHAIKGEDYDLVELLLGRYFTTITDSMWPAVLRDLMQIPDEVLRESLGISTVIGFVLHNNLETRRLSYEWFEISLQAVDAKLKQQLPRAEKARILNLRSVALRYLGLAQESLEVSNQVLSITPDLDADERAHLGKQYGLILGQSALSAFYAENYVIATDASQLAIDWAIRQGNADSEGVYRGNFAAVEVMAGDFESARSQIEAIPDHSSSRLNESNYNSTLLRVAQAFCAVNEGNPGAALDLLKPYSRPEYYTEHWSHVTIVKVLATAMAGDVQGAEQELAFALDTYIDRYTAPGVHHRLAILFETIRMGSGILVAGKSDQSEKHVRLTPLDAAASAIRLTLGGAYEEAFDELSVANTTSRSQLHKALTAIAGVSLSLRAELPHLGVRSFLRQITLLHEKFDIAWPLMFLSDVDRHEALQRVTGTPGPAGFVEQLSALFEMIPAVMPDSAEMVVLTVREQEVLQRLALTPNREEIAQALFVSENTVKTQLSSLYRKLRVSSRSGALAKAFNLGLISTHFLD